MVGFDEAMEGGSDFGGWEGVSFAEGGVREVSAVADGDGLAGAGEEALFADALLAEEESLDGAGGGVLEAGGGASEVPEVAEAGADFLLMDGAFEVDDAEDDGGEFAWGEFVRFLAAWDWELGELVGDGEIGEGRGLLDGFFAIGAGVGGEGRGGGGGGWRWEGGWVCGLGWGVGAGVLDGGGDGVELLAGALEPIEAPDAVEVPSVVLEDGVTEAVAGAGEAGGLVVGAVALEAEEVVAGAGGIGDGEVDEEAGDAEAWGGVMVEGLEGAADGLFEFGEGLCGFGGVGLEVSGLGEREERLEGSHAAAGGAGEVEVFGAEGGEDHALAFGAGDEDVESPFTAFGAEGAEAEGEMAAGVAGVADGDEDDVAFVALDVLEVFDEEGFVGVGGEEGFGGGMFAAEEFKFVEDGLLLADGEGGDAEGEVGGMPGVGEDGVRDGLGFDEVGAGAAGVEDAVGDGVEVVAGGGGWGVGAGDDAEAVFVEFAVGDGDEGVVAAAVVPAEHGLGQAAGAAEAEDALHVAGLGGVGGGFLLGVGEIAGDAGKEAGGRELAAIADDDDLSGAGDRAEGVDRFDLAGFVDNEEVELDGAGFQELGDGQGAHHEDGFDGLDDGAGFAEEASDGAVASFPFEFGAHDAGGAEGGVGGGEAFEVGEEGAMAGEGEAFLVEQAKGGDGAFVEEAIELGEGGALGEGEAGELAKRGVLEGKGGVGGGKRTGFEAIEERAEGEEACLGGAGVVLGPAGQAFEVGQPLAAAIFEVGPGDVFEGGGEEGDGDIEVECLGEGGGFGASYGQVAFEGREQGGDLVRVLEVGDEATEAGVEAGLLLSGDPIEDGGEGGPGAAFGAPGLAEGGGAGGLALADEAEGTLAGEKVIDQGEALGERGGERGAGDAAELGQGLAVIAVEEAQPGTAVGGQVKAGVGEVEVPGGVGDLGSEAGGEVGELAASSQEFVEPIEPGLPDAGGEGLAVHGWGGGDVLGHEEEAIGVGEGGGGLAAEGLGQGRRAGAQSLQGGRQLFDLGGEGVEVEGEDGGAASASPGVVVRDPEFLQSGRQFGDEVSAFLEVGAGPPRGVGQGEVGGGRGGGAEGEEMADDGEGAELRGGERLVEGGDMAVQGIAMAFEFGKQGFEVLGFGASEFPGAAEFFEDGAFAGFVAMEFEAEGPESFALEAAFDDFEGGEFLGHKEHAFAVEDGGGDEVGDGLAFAGSRGSLDHGTAALADGFDGEGLGAIGVHDMVEAGDGDEGIEVSIFGEWGGLFGEAALEEALDEGVLEQVGRGRPARRVEVAVHEELGEGEEPEGHGVGEDFPRGVVADGVGDGREVGGGAEVIGVGEGGEFEVEVAEQTGAQGEVFLEVLFAGAEEEAVGGGAALEFDGEEEEGGEARGIGVGRFEPSELAEGEVEHVDSLFLDHGEGIAVEVQESALEAFGAEPGLEAGVGVSSGESGGGVDGVFLGLGEGEGLVVVGRGRCGRGLGGDEVWGVGGWAGEEGEGFTFLDEEAEHLVAEFVEEVDQAGGGGGWGDGEEAVAGREVEQFAAVAVEEFVGAQGHGRGEVGVAGEGEDGAREA